MSSIRVVLAFVVAAVCPIAQIAESLHEGAVRHVICAEHGELTHVTVSDAPADALAQDIRPTVRGDQSSIEHEHCHQPGILRKAAPAPALIASPAPEPTGPALGEPASYIAPGTRLLLCAPKTSPPVA